MNIKNSDVPFMWILCKTHPRFTFRVMWVIERKASSVFGQ